MCQDHVFTSCNGHCDVIWRAVCSRRATLVHQLFDNGCRRDDDCGGGTDFQRIDFSIFLSPLGEANAAMTLLEGRDACRAEGIADERVVSVFFWEYVQITQERNSRWT